MANEAIDKGLYNGERDLELILKILNHFPMMKLKRVIVQIIL
jgi:hypothetical protein